jgi:AraC-like DNA-binding protein
MGGTRVSMLSFQLPPFPTFIKGGVATFNIGTKHFKRTFSVFDFIYVMKGELYLTDNEKKYKVSEGEYKILPPHREHYGHEGCTTESVYFWLHFLVENDYEITNEIESVNWSMISTQDATFTEPASYQFFLPLYGIIKQREMVEGVLKRLVELDTLQSPDHKIWQQIIFNEFILLLQKEAIHMPSSAEQVTEKVISYLHKHYQETIKMNDIGQAILFHPDYLTRCMQQVTGLSPIQYLNKYRISRAKQLIATTNETLSSIAHEVGFVDSTYFSKLFRKIEGMTPIEYRRVVSRG